MQGSRPADTNLTPRVVCIRDFQLACGGFTPYGCLPLETGTRKPCRQVPNCETYVDEGVCHYR